MLKRTITGGRKVKIKFDIERAIEITSSAKKQHEETAKKFKEDEIMCLTQKRAANDFEKAEEALKNCLKWCV